MRKTLTGLGMVLVGNSPEAFAAIMKAGSPYWDGIIKTLGLRLR